MNNKLGLYIPTRGRVHKQRTFNGLPPGLQKNATLVIDHNDADDYGTAKVWRLPRLRGWGDILQTIVNESPERFVAIMDDDMVFQYRDPAGAGIFNGTPEQVVTAFETLHGWMKSGIVHVSMAERTADFSNLTDEYRDNKRCMHILAYDTKALRSLPVGFTKGVDVAKFAMTDFHMGLQLLKLGHHNRVSYRYNYSVTSSNAKGGASLWRTLDRQNYSAQTLAKLHPGLVVAKAKHGWQGMEGERWDVVIQWGKALGVGL